MDHAYLSAIMHGEVSIKKKEAPKAETSKKIQLHKEVDRQIDSYVDGLELEEDFNGSHNGLMSPLQKKEKLKFEMKEAAKLTKLSQQLDAALTLLSSEASKYLTQEAFERLKSDFNTASTVLSDVKAENFINTDLQKLAEISDETMQSIAEIAIAKFSEERFEECLSLFVLLTNLNPNNPDFWFRQGISAQKCNDLELASNSYEAAAELDRNAIGQVLLAAQCYIMQDRTEEAKNKINAAKKIAAEAKGEVEASWLELIPALEGLIQGK